MILKYLFILYTCTVVVWGSAIPDLTTISPVIGWFDASRILGSSTTISQWPNLVNKTNSLRVTNDDNLLTKSVYNGISGVAFTGTEALEIKFSARRFRTGVTVVVVGQFGDVNTVMEIGGVVFTKRNNGFVVLNNNGQEISAPSYVETTSSGWTVRSVVLESDLITRSSDVVSFNLGKSQFRGRIAEVIIFESTMTNLNTNDVFQSYIASKYAILRQPTIFASNTGTIAVNDTTETTKIVIVIVGVIILLLLICVGITIYCTMKTVSRKVLVAKTFPDYADPIAYNSGPSSKRQLVSEVFTNNRWSRAYIQKRVDKVRKDEQMRNQQPPQDDIAKSGRMDGYSNNNNPNPYHYQQQYHQHQPPVPQIPQSMYSQTQQSMHRTNSAPKLPLPMPPMPAMPNAHIATIQGPGLVKSSSQHSLKKSNSSINNLSRYDSPQYDPAGSNGQGYNIFRGGKQGGGSTVNTMNGNGSNNNINNTLRAAARPSVGKVIPLEELERMQNNNNNNYGQDRGSLGVDSNGNRISQTETLNESDGHPSWFRPPTAYYGNS